MGARPFSFDTDFGHAGAAAPRAKRVYLAAEVEEIRQAARKEGERVAVAEAEAAQARLLAEIAGCAKAALASLAQAAHEHKQGSAELALAAARVIASGALARFPEAPIKAALEALAREVEAQPRLVVRLADPGEKLRSAVETALAEAGFAGQLAFRADPDLPAAGFVIEWADGRAGFDPKEAERRIAESFEAALAAEGLHGEAVLPAPDSKDT
jgi:flagellar assembly protein FliH